MTLSTRGRITFSKRLSQQILRGLSKLTVSDRPTVDPSRTKCLVDYGGAIATADPTFSSYAHRDAFLVIQFYGSAQDINSSFPEDGIDIVNGMVTSLSPNPAAACESISPTHCCHRNLTLLVCRPELYRPNVERRPMAISILRTEYLPTHANQSCLRPEQSFHIPPIHSIALELSQKLLWAGINTCDSGWWFCLLPLDNVINMSARYLSARGRMDLVRIPRHLLAPSCNRLLAFLEIHAQRSW
jgi:hypothetical protein